MADETDRRSGRLRLGQLLALLAAAPALLVVAAVVVGIVAVVHQNTVRGELLAHVEPTNAASLRLEVAMLNEETGIRGYELTGRAAFLDPYRLGVSQELRYTREIREDTSPGMAVTADLDAVTAAIHVWHVESATPALRRTGGRLADPRDAIDASVAAKTRFNAIREALGKLQNRLLEVVRTTKAQLNQASDTTEVALSVIGAALILSLLSAGFLLRRYVTRPISRLATSARRVAGGELEHSVGLRGPRDLELLSEDVDGMRVALLWELARSQDTQAALAGTAAELQRSNTELEQFAYVASHDLQEPLRKVTSFCQLLEARYSGQLDERGQQYIDFAVDGAKRMQQLVNDLLAFSRVGRQSQGFRETALSDLAAAAATDLERSVSESAAEVIVGELPTLPVEPALLRAVFQNLLANAIKFRSETSPRVEIAAERDDALPGWRISCADNGIGIEPEYAERIFVIFQRLHTREAYPGTGIGLAMCRKIIEHHGGRMWLDQDYTQGTRMYFTLPDEPAAPITGGQTQ